MTKRKYTPSSEQEEILTDERKSFLDFESARVAARGLDTFKVYKLDPVTGAPVLVLDVLGHEIGMSKAESDIAKLPIYQVVEYVEIKGENMLVTKAINKGSEFNPEKSQNVTVEFLEEGSKFVQVVKAYLWPGEWSFVERELGDPITE